MKCKLYLLSVLSLALLLISSCGILHKSKQSQHIKTDSTVRKEVDSSAVHSKDSTRVYQRLKEDEQSLTIEVEPNDTDNRLTDTLRFPMVNGSDYFNIPIKGKVKKITYIGKKIDLAKDSTRIVQQDAGQLKRTEQVSVKKDEKKVNSSKTSFNVSIWLWIILLIAAAITIYRRRKQIIDWFIYKATGV